MSNNGFKFNFFDTAIEASEPTKGRLADKSAVLPVKKLNLSDVWPPGLTLPIRKFLLPNETSLEYFNGTAVEELVKQSASGGEANMVMDEVCLKALSAGKDVVSGVIEGGFTVWDGTRHLIEHIINLNVNFHGKRVLDLGCGCGLLGIYALANEASHVAFQEYNEAVLKAWTIPNVTLSLPEADNKRERVSFYSGDWRELSKLWRRQSGSSAVHFDIILAAEVIYRPELYSKLHEIFAVALDPSAEHAEIFLASKMQYYGTKGNVIDFTAFLDGKHVFSHATTQLTISGIAYVCVRLKRL